MKYSNNNAIINNRSKVLLYLGKFPNKGRDIDGGSILAYHLINLLSKRFELDITFLRKDDETYANDEVNSIRYLKYINPSRDKFLRRLDNLNSNYEALKNYRAYDFIIIAHVSKAFLPVDMPKEFWNKVIIFPMFCTGSYVKSGQVVPKEYTLLEGRCLKLARHIVTPSILEKEDLIHDYDVNPNNISVILRGINPNIKYKVKSINLNNVNLISIGSVKIQKNNLLQLEILKSLLDLGYKVNLNLVINVQNKEIYQGMISYIKENNLSNHVNIFENIPQEKLVEVINDSDINISTSTWETFGRGIFEGATGGLPSVVSDKLDIVKRIVNNNPGIFFVKNKDEYIEIIKKLIDDNVFYKHSSESLKELIDEVSYAKEDELLLECFNKVINFNNDEII